MKENLGDRMKAYEAAFSQQMMRRAYTIIRLDGRSFSNYTSKLSKPFDEDFSNAMLETAVQLCYDIQGAKIAYSHSDEISVVITDFDNVETQPWFGNKIQKMVSVSASIATAHFNEIRAYQLGMNHDSNSLPTFDSRVFQLPSFTEVVNYLIWRQRACITNSISAAAQANFSHKELEGKKSAEKKEMLASIGSDWNLHPNEFKYGAVIKKQVKMAGTSWGPDLETPVFTENKNYLNELIPKP